MTGLHPAGLLPLSEVRKRLTAADGAAADLRGLLRAAEVAAGRPLAGGPA